MSAKYDGVHPTGKYTEAARKASMNAQQGKRRERTVGGAARVLAPCCTPLLIGTFQDQTLVRLENRHMGRQCYGAVEPVDIKAWRQAKGLR